MTSNDDIMRALGSIEAGLKATNDNLQLLRNEVKDEKNDAHASRAEIHRRLNETNEKFGKLETKVIISGQIDAQMRDQIVTLEKTVATNHKAVQPALEDWGRVKILGWGVGFVFFSLGISAVSIYAWAWEWAKGMMRWLAGH